MRRDEVGIPNYKTSTMDVEDEGLIRRGWCRSGCVEVQERKVGMLGGEMDCLDLCRRGYVDASMSIAIRGVSVSIQGVSIDGRHFDSWMFVRQGQRDGEQLER